MNRENKLIKNTFILSIGTFLPRLAGYVTLPILTGYLTKDTAWVYVEMRVPEKYKGVQGYLPLRVVKYDKRLILPGSVLAVLEPLDSLPLISQPLKNVQ